MPEFQILALDPSRRTRCETAANLLSMVLGFGQLWHDPKPDNTALRIIDGEVVLEVADQHPQSQKDENRGMRGFLISVNGPYERLEPLREPLVEYIKDLAFENRYVVRDEISEEIACRLYPSLYKIENALRGFLIRFMATRIGPTWWQLNASSEMSDKAKIRKKNELVFGKHIDTSAHLIDFGELGELVYEQSSGFLTREDIVRRVNALEETPDAVRSLKQDIGTNYQRYFRESFADRDFKTKWKEWEGLRNKIAHNNLFTADDLKRGHLLAGEILSIIAAADQSTSTITITQDEREAIQEQVIAKSEATQAAASPPEPTPVAQTTQWSPQWKEISESSFLDELNTQESIYRNKPHGFVGLTRFVRFHLGELGYDYASSFSIFQRLKDAGRIEVYPVPNPYNDALPTSAIRTAPAPVKG